jgi:hypothetical protein
MFMVLVPLRSVRRVAPQQNRFVIRFNHGDRRASIATMAI